MTLPPLNKFAAFNFVGGRHGPGISKITGCDIDECLGLDGVCSWGNCGGYDYTGCEYGQCLGEDGASCSSDNCVSNISGCKANQCLGRDGNCSSNNCHWAIEKPMPLSMENTDEIRTKYSKIVWKSRNRDLSGNQIKTCDQDNPNAAYVLYMYRDYNYKNLYDVVRIRCNDWRHDISGARSYILVKETPGVYFYGNENCYPKGDTPPNVFTESIPEGWPDQIKSIRIVNGHDRAKGPFYGLIYMNDYDYKTSENPWSMEIQAKTWKWPDFEAYDNYSYCFPIRSDVKGGSWAIYKWAGFEEDGKTVAKTGDGVTLYTRTGWLGGFNELKGEKGSFLRLSADLKNTKVSYSEQSDIPKEEQKLCPSFDPDFPCLKSFEIKGDYLVIASSEKFRGVNAYHQPDVFFNVQAQVFPISPRLKEIYKSEVLQTRKQDYTVEKGTPELLLEYISSVKGAKFIEVIPLAGPLK
ncbi:MAG: hypothetical protein HYT36_00760 [Candidatus Staskawiczbacteria bacterium]|nr:hypothetical protein [Candidatus Staskawiczbacteria bacterium]